MVERKPTEERKEEIFKAALKIVYEGGKESLTIRCIADQVGISEAAIYRHFDNKKDILIQLARKVFSQDRLEFGGKRSDEPAQFLESLITSIFSSLEENPYSTVLLFHEELFTEYPELREMFQKHREKKMEKITGFIRRAQEKNKVSGDVNPKAFAKILAGSVRMEVIEWRSKNFSYSLQDRAKSLATELSKILKKEDTA